MTLNERGWGVVNVSPFTVVEAEEKRRVSFDSLREVRDIFFSQIYMVDVCFFSQILYVLIN